MTKLTPRAGSGLLFCVGVAEERGAPGTAVAEADSRRKMSNPTFSTMMGMRQQQQQLKGLHFSKVTFCPHPAGRNGFAPALRVGRADRR